MKKVLKRVWLTLVAMPTTLVVAAYLVTMGIWSGEADHEPWRFWRW